MLLALLAFSFLLAKVAIPYRWHHYADRAMFHKRAWYGHPQLGPMYLDRAQLQAMRSMCSVIAHSPDKPDLLSLPYPYANYFCDITPWQGYVQTWYDTSSPARIGELMHALEQPPSWIVYQRALDSIRAHEQYFNHDRPLPHRALDGYILEKVASGQWTVVSQQCLTNANWILIETRPAGTHTPPRSAFPVWTAQVCSPDDYIER